MHVHGVIDLVGQVRATSMQMQMTTRLGNGYEYTFGFRIEEATAVPVHGPTQISNRIVGVLWA